MLNRKKNEMLTKQTRKNSGVQHDYFEVLYTYSSDTQVSRAFRPNRASFLSKLSTSRLRRASALQNKKRTEGTVAARATLLP